MPAARFRPPAFFREAFFPDTFLPHDTGDLFGGADPTERYVDDFVVYRSTQAEGVYYEIGHTRGDSFVDRGARNGRTYFYAVSAVDHCGYETDLSREIAFDTPRPEGFDAEVTLSTPNPKLEPCARPTSG